LVQFRHEVAQAHLRLEQAEAAHKATAASGDAANPKPSQRSRAKPATPTPVRG
jgi:hypothetical protein